mmetsp:Transcript_17619/g.49136  ORF Transcript_17619/g.49136 Transcript_17619/m.49136 type:complete len:82 (+) Transcript_17619:1633-1878(+)
MQPSIHMSDSIWKFQFSHIHLSITTIITNQASTCHSAQRSPSQFLQPSMQANTHMSDSSFHIQASPPPKQASIASFHNAYC